MELETISAGKNTSIYKLIQGLNGAGEIPGQVTHGNGNATLTLLFNAPVYIEPSECSGDGNKPNDGGSNMPEDKKISYFQRIKTKIKRKYRKSIKGSLTLMHKIKAVKIYVEFYSFLCIIEVAETI